MDTVSMKNLLMSHAEACMKLADELSDEGGALTSDERQLIRVASMPAIRELNDMICSSYLVGNERWMRDNLKTLKGYLDWV